MASLLGSDLTFNQGSELLSRLARAGLSLEQAKRLLSDESVATTWVKAFPCSTTESLPSFKVTINYDYPFEQMVSDGKYDWVNEHITAKNFPIKGKGVAEIEILLVHLDRYAETKEVEAELDKRGLRPATLEELLVLGAIHSHLQRDYPIVALGSRCLLDDDEYVPVLDRGDEERVLDLGCYQNEWDNNCRFAAVRK